MEKHKKLSIYTPFKGITKYKYTAVNLPHHSRLINSQKPYDKETYYVESIS